MQHSPHRAGRRKAWIVGGGIAGLASAVYLIRDAGFEGGDITIFNQDGVSGGALDGSGSAATGYSIRGGRMLEEHFVCTWDLLSGIPTLDNPELSVTQETFEFNHRVVSCSHSRLVRAASKLDVSSYGLSKHDTFDLLRLTVMPENLLGARRIDEWFAPDFFDTVFWQLWATTFAFQRWSSLAEMRRYALRFMHLLPGFNQLKGIMRTVHNQYESVILPIEQWLRQRGVDFRMDTTVTDIDFEITATEKRAATLHFQARSGPDRIVLGAQDYLFVTLGSMVESTTLGSMTAAAPSEHEGAAGAWALWERIAARDPAFGRPAVFNGDTDRSRWMSFTVTFEDSTFFDHMERFTGNKAGTGGLVTIADSNWLMSVVLAHQPHFRNQPAGTFVCWGDGLLADRQGNFVRKPMTRCNGEEILHELFSHLRIVELMRPVSARLNCIPCLMPYIDSQFMPRAPGDRPAVIPDGARNFAFLGQFVEVAHDCVFTVEYSVRTAQTAVFGLFDVAREVSPIHRGDHEIDVVRSALQALFR